jgi:hypothetical protein
MTVKSEGLVAETITVAAAAPLWQRLSWGAVIGGIVVSLVIQFFLSLLGLGIGVATIDPQGQSPEARTITLAAGIWWAASGVIAAAAGGWIAGRMSASIRPGGGALHGFVTWSATTLIIVFLLTGLVGGIAGGAVSLVGNTLSSAASVATERGIDPRAAQVLSRMVTGGGQLSPEDRTAAIDALVDAGFARDQATKLLDRQAPTKPAAGGQTSAADTETAEADARAIAERAANTISKAALWSVLALLLGAIAGALSGAGGATREPELVAAEVR